MSRDRCPPRMNGDMGDLPPESGAPVLSPPRRLRKWKRDKERGKEERGKTDKKKERQEEGRGGRRTVREHSCQHRPACLLYTKTPALCDLGQVCLGLYSFLGPQPTSSFS